MAEKKIKTLLRKYLQGRATPEEEELVDRWYEGLSTDADEQRLSETERTALRDSYWESLKRNMHPQGGKNVHLRPGFLAVAASVAAIAIVAFFFYPARDTQPALTQVQSMKEFVNDTDAVSRIVLPDGSEIVLSSGSTLRYPREFNVTERKVHLIGEAFFDIAHNKRKPFYVFANEVVTKVLGTRFTVTAYPEAESIIVAVKSGKVAVHAEPEEDKITLDEGIILTPNQQAVYSKADRKVSRLLVKSPQVVIPEEEVEKMRFEGVAVAEIFNTLERMYNVEIEFDESAFSGCSVTTSVTGNDLYEKIDVICEITGATYTVQNTTILISGVGCN